MARPPPVNPIPPGWFECPDIGEVSELHHMIPMKVPLGCTFRNPRMEDITHGRWTPLAALTAAHHKIAAKDPTGQVGMVLDLSNSDKYYDPAAITDNSVRYVKVSGSAYSYRRGTTDADQVRPNERASCLFRQACIGAGSKSQCVSCTGCRNDDMACWRKNSKQLISNNSGAQNPK
eukprot:GHRQ01011669.1.p1 GENE.GHRQ01011669.1~~GHRQ01011669.1.p1  ORF type:complete len:176 (+),score=22.07 GHRQ01011669.1:403-930(+)